MNKIYFIAADNRIKVGHTKNLRSRLASFNTVLTNALELIGSIDGDRWLEQAIHERLAEFHIANEWFRDCPELREFIKEMMARGPAEMGIVPLPRPEAGKPFVPGPVAPDAAQKILRLIWPDDCVMQLMAFTGETEDTCRAWMKCEQKFPRLICYALRGLFHQFMVGSPSPDFVAEDRAEQRERA